METMSLDLLQKKNSTGIRGAAMTVPSKRKVIPTEMIARAVLLTKQNGEIVQLNLGDWLIPFDCNPGEMRDEVKPQLDEIVKAIRDLNVMVEVKVHPAIKELDVHNRDLYQKRSTAIIF